MSLYFIRHGQTILNTKHCFNGDTDEELTEVGVQQATSMGEYFRGLKIDEIVCSPLKRTRKTLECLKLDKNIPVRYDERLVERKEGILCGTEITEDIMSRIYLNVRPKESVQGLETIDEVFARVHSALEDIKEKAKTKNVLIVAHGFVGRAVYFYFNPLPESGLLSDVPESFPLNCEVKRFEFK